MRPQPLGLVAAVLAGLILFSRGSRPPAPSPAPSAAPGAQQSAPVTAPPPAPAPARRAPRVAPLPGALEPPGGSATPASDLLAVLATRRRIAREAGRVYLDSAWSQTDSVVVHWTERGDRPILVRFTGDSALEGWTADFVEAARQGMRAWNQNAADLRFREVADSVDAEIEVAFVQGVSEDGEFGVTELSWGPEGRATRAVIRLALSPDSSVHLVPIPVMRRVAIHEFGHAIGLPHSSDRDDIMYPSSPVNAPSRRDQATLRLLYALPTGSLRTP